MFLVSRNNKTKLINHFFKKVDVLLSVCTHRTIDIDALTSVMNLFGQNKHNITWCPVRGDALIDRARSRVASYFLCERKEDVLFFLDDDIVFKTEDIIKVVDDIVNGADIAGAMYVQKGTLGKTAVFFDGQSVMFQKNAPIVEVEAISTGFMAIHRRVFKKMVEREIVPLCVKYFGSADFYPFFQPYPILKNGQYIYLSEDWAFCQRARDLGFKIFLDPSIFLGHKGEYIYDLGDKARSPKIKINDDFIVTLK